MDQRTRRAVVAVNLPLADIAFADVMAERLGLPVFVDNDSNLAALAEHRCGGDTAKGIRLMPRRIGRRADHRAEQLHPPRQALGRQARHTLAQPLAQPLELEDHLGLRADIVLEAVLGAARVLRVLRHERVHVLTGADGYHDWGKAVPEAAP